MPYLTLPSQYPYVQILYGTVSATEAILWSLVILQIVLLGFPMLDGNDERP